MIVVSDTAALAEHLTPLRDRAGTIAFVPTMGNLHEGHLALVHQARAAADAVVVSIFVNPMQFAAHEDLDTYPRTLDDDLSALREAGVDLVLTPSADDIYPDTSARHTAIHVPELGEALCGKDRPGHFDGVCTVVYKLFQLVGPDIAVFGEKDLQQLLIIKKDGCRPQPAHRHTVRGHSTCGRWPRVELPQPVPVAIRTRRGALAVADLAKLWRSAHGNTPRTASVDYRLCQSGAGAGRI